LLKKKLRWTAFVFKPISSFSFYRISINYFNAGVVTIPGTTLLTPGDVAKRLKASRASALVADAATISRLLSSPQDCPPEILSSLKVVICAGDFPATVRWASKIDVTYESDHECPIKSLFKVWE
jgi:hypothetical protein